MSRASETKVSYSIPKLGPCSTADSISACRPYAASSRPCLNDLYLVRLIHCQTRRAFPGERLWTAAQLTHPATIRFLRVRNREGCDVYIHPYAEVRNPGYILIDLDHPDPAVVENMRTHDF
jgi:hypothetical protein